MGPRNRMVVWPNPVHRPHHGQDRVPREDEDEYDRDIKEVPMQVLKNEKLRLTLVLHAGLAHRAARRIKKNRAIVGLAIIVASATKTSRGPENQQRWSLHENREVFQPVRIEKGREHRGKIRTVFVISLAVRPERVEPRPSGVNDER